MYLVCVIHQGVASTCPVLAFSVLDEFQALLPMRTRLLALLDWPGLSWDGTDSAPTYQRGGGKMLATFLGMAYISSSFLPSVLPPLGS